MMKKRVAIFSLAIFLGFAIGVIWSHAVGMPQSPYLKHTQRLSDVVAAIQVMGKYTFDNLNPGRWKQIIGDPRSAKSWSDVFNEHSEFFRTSEDTTSKTSKDSIKISLAWRRARTWSWDTKQEKKIAQDSLNYYKKNLPERLSREPLSDEQITALVEIAIKMQTQAIARREELRWWIPVVVGALGVLVGALVKS